jgi:hypothetical protein
VSVEVVGGCVSGVSRSRRVLLVGELNPYGSRPELALYHLPRGASGDRLRTYLGLTDVAYHRLEKVNLCGGGWEPGWARLAALDVLRRAEHDVLVLLGARVRDAFGGPVFFASARRRDCALVSLPHPSGRCRLWNDLANVERAVAAMRSLVPEIPWGEARDWRGRADVRLVQQEHDSRRSEEERKTWWIV